jgi:hypothetical protein
MRRENIAVEVSRPWDSRQHTRPPSVELRNRGKTRAESLHTPSSEEDEEAPAIGADDYTGALSEPGESDQEAECRSEESSAKSSRSSHSPGSTNKEADIYVAPSRYAPSVVHIADHLVFHLDPQAQVMLGLLQHPMSYPHLASSKAPPQ